MKFEDSGLSRYSMETNFTVMVSDFDLPKESSHPMKFETCFIETKREAM